jgi:hypothetical protein
MPELVYLACPYSHPDPAVRAARFEAANRAAAKLMAEGLLVFSPISHTHPIALAGGLPTGWDYWERYDRAILHQCRAMFVLPLDGWCESAGVRAEMLLAEEMGLPVYFLQETDAAGTLGAGKLADPIPSRAACPACGGPTVDRGSAVWCDRCKQKVETCCDGGNLAVERSVVG